MKRKRSVIIEWMGSYILILLIPVITIFINYNYNAKVIREEIIRANEQVLKNVQDSIDGFLEKENSLINYTVTMADFMSLISKTNMDGSFYLDVRDLKHEIEDYRGLGTEISYFLYLKEKDYVICRSANGYSKIFHNAVMYQKKEMIDYASWKNLIAKEYHEEFFISEYFGYTNLQPCLIYGNTVAYEDYEPINLFFVLPISEIEQLIDSMEDGTILLLQTQEKTILAMDNQGMTDIPAEMELSACQNEIFETTEYIGMQRASKQKGVLYSMLVPKTEFWKKAQYVRNILACSLSLSLLIGAVCVYYLMRRNYRPVSELLVKTNGSRMNGNEFLQIEQSINNLTFENKKMQTRILTQKEILLKNWLLAMMKGKYAGISKQTEEFLTLKQDEKISLVVFQIPMLDKQELQYDYLLSFAIENVFSELMEKESMYQTEDGTYLFYLFVIEAAQEEEWKKTCLEKTEFLCSFIEEKWKCGVTAAISACESELESMRFMYQEVMDALEYGKMIGEYNVIDVESLREDFGSVSEKMLGNQLETAIYKGDFEKMQLLSEELFDPSRTHTFPLLRMQVLEVFQMLAKVFDNCEGADGLRIELAGYLTPMLDTTEWQEMKAVFDEVLRYIYKNLHAQQKNEDIVLEVRTFLEKNYTDSSLNIGTIAEAIGKKSRYISKIYKEETGEGILDYLNELRINQAKLLLCTNKAYMLEEISDMVGYASYKTFRRIFIKQTGTTPGRFADIKAECEMDYVMDKKDKELI